MATTKAAMPSPRTAPRQPMTPIVSAAANPTTTVPTLPPATWTAIALTEPVGRELLGEERVADGVLGRAADARDDVRDGERRERLRRGLERGPDAHGQAARRRARSCG